jgi:uncharacterized protein (TIGR03382 family)
MLLTVFGASLFVACADYPTVASRADDGFEQPNQNDTGGRPSTPTTGGTSQISFAGATSTGGSTDTPTEPVCGNGVLEAGEICDEGEGNKTPGCADDCTDQDPDYYCEPGSPCVDTVVCGNGVLEGDEVCDEGEGNKTDGCAVGCDEITAGWSCPRPGRSCVAIPECGNGVRERGEECDDNYCYVVLGDRENCLDPRGAFRVYTPSLANVQTGETIRLRLFANRENAPIEYRWTVVQAPSGSGATVANPYGSVRLSTPFEYHYAEDNIATFTPDEPGEYLIRLEGTQVWEDEVSGELGETSEALALLVVEGDSLNAGCSAAPGAPAAGSLALLALLGLFIARRRK